jgi:hypothetical protein
MTTTGKNWIMIFGPKNDGTYVVEFRTAEGETLGISIPGSEAKVIRHLGAHVLRAVRAGRSVRNLWRAHVFPYCSPHSDDSPLYAHRRATPEPRRRSRQLLWRTSPLITRRTSIQDTLKFKNWILANGCISVPSFLKTAI